MCKGAGMKRFFVCSVSVCFFLFVGAVLADVTMRDIWRWGLVRKTDVLPVGSAMIYETGGVLRVIEEVERVDSNRVVLVFTNSASSVPAGVYVSSGKSSQVPWDRYVFASPQSWALDMGGQAVDVIFSEGFSNNLGWAFAAQEVRRPLGGAGLFGQAGSRVLIAPVWVMLSYGDPVDGVYPAVHAVVDRDNWIGVASNVPVDAVEVVFSGLDQIGDKSCYGAATVRLDTNAYCFWVSQAGDKYFWLEMDGDRPVYPFVMSNVNNVIATGRYAHRFAQVTNDFVSAERLDDAINDLRQEMAEALEAHVELLH